MSRVSRSHLAGMSLVMAFVLLVLGTGMGQGAGIISKFSPDGTPLASFDAGLRADQQVSFIKVDPSGNIWIGRSDITHGDTPFKPNDMVAKVSPNGTELFTVKGPMQDPSSIAFDSGGNIYIGGSPDGGSILVTQIYKYDPSGNFLFSFGQLGGVLLGAGWRDLIFAPGDRVFGTTGNPHSVQELTTAGTLLNVVGPFDGTIRLGLALALSPDGGTLWNSQAQNGPGEHFIVGYGLNLSVISAIGLDFLGNLFPTRLETLSNGHLLTMDVDNGVIYELADNGTLVKSLRLSGLDGIYPFAFTLDRNENILIGHATGIEPAHRCPLGQGFWKTDPDAWPVTSLTLGSQTYSQVELLNLLNMPVRGDASLILADQLIATKLNIAHGSDPTPVSSTIIDADNLLRQFANKLPYRVAPSSSTGQRMVGDANMLDAYNNGNLTPNCQP